MSFQPLETKKILKDWAQSQNRCQAIYGFGSYFSQQTHANSDIDLAIFFDRPLPSLERWKLGEDLGILLTCPVDLIDLRSVALALQHHILATGERLFARDPVQTLAWEAYVLSAYCRFQEERKGILQDIAQRGSVYG